MATVRAGEFEFDWNDPNTGQLSVRQSRDGGYVAFGLGRGATLLAELDRFKPRTAFLGGCRKISDELADNSRYSAYREALPEYLAKIPDASLRTLAVAGQLLKAGFNPDEPRDERGRWTAEGGDRDTEGTIDPEDVVYHGDYHNYLVQIYAQITRTHGGAAVTSVPLTALNGVTAVADLVVRPHGWPPFAIEIKTGMNPAFTPNQSYVYAQLPVPGHLSSSKDLTSVGLPRLGPLPPMRLLLVYTPGPGAPVFYDWWPPLPAE